MGTESTARADGPGRVTSPWAAHLRPTRAVVYLWMRAVMATLLALAALVGSAAPASAYDAADLRATLTREMRGATPSSGADVVDLDSGAELFALRASTARVPASV